MNTIFDEEIAIIHQSLASLDTEEFDKLMADCLASIKSGGKVIVSGLGKNVPLCEKFVGTMHSLGMAAAFMHTNSAIHGDMGMIKDGDTLILLTKSGETAESIHLFNLIKDREIKLWLLTFSPDSYLARQMPRALILEMSHEGDQWNIVPNNSSLINLIVLQKLSMKLAEKLPASLAEFKRNHPGGHIGEMLKCTV